VERVSGIGALAAAIGSGAVVVTATRRLARALGRTYAELQLAAGRGVWETPLILPWPAWLERCALDAVAPPPPLLSAMQSRCVWEAVIGASAEGARLLSPARTAVTAAEAYELLGDFRLTPADLRGADAAGDAGAFIDWAGDYEHRVAALGRMDRSRLPQWLLDHRPAAGGARASLLAAGFIDFSPAQRALLAAEHGVVPWSPDDHRARVVRVEAADAASEFELAARWARSRLEGNEAARIAIVVPDLGTHRGAIARVLDEVLAPRSVLDAGDRHPRPYNISLGEPLARYAPIDAALRTLRFAAGPLSLAEAGAVLRAPWIAAADRERDDRAVLDARLRREGRPEIGIDGVIACAERDAAALPVLCDRLRAVRALARSAPRRAPPSAWAAHFDALLRAAGWPGPRPLDSREHQVLEAWKEALDQLSGLDAVEAAAGHARAQALLERIAAERIFQPESAEVPIQVLGMLEGIGQRFDHLWLAGLHEERWPPPIDPNPLLSARLQRRHLMPQADRARALERAQRILESYLGAAPEVVVSAPAMEADRALRPSALIARIPRVAPETLGLSACVSPAALVHGAPHLLPFEDAVAPALPAPARVAGGVGVFRDQAACPFRAWARHRLAARGLDRPHLGLDARERGILVHAALKALWEALGDHASLVALTPGEIAARAGAAARTALARLGPRPRALGGRLLDLERRRLERLLAQWLALERQRAPFRVERTEVGRTMRLGGVEFDTRIDRVDRLADGRAVLIDYKTGDAERFGPWRWFGPRPDDPQLPLYCLAADAPVAAVLIGALAAGDLRFKGIAAQDGITPGVAAFSGFPTVSAWDELPGHWRQALERLGEAFRNGDARVDPKSEESCASCDLHALCRIHECGLPGGGGER
jgi:probable DNA repair protein